MFVSCAIVKVNDRLSHMGLTSSRAERTELLDMLVPLAFRHCVTDLTTEHLTDREKENIEKFVFRWVESYARTKERTGEQVLLDDYRDFLDA